MGLFVGAAATIRRHARVAYVVEEDAKARDDAWLEKMQNLEISPGQLVIGIGKATGLRAVNWAAPGKERESEHAYLPELENPRTGNTRLDRLVLCANSPQRPTRMLPCR
jgi:hypothetical protein